MDEARFPHLTKAFVRTTQADGFASDSDLDDEDYVPRSPKMDSFEPPSPSSIPSSPGTDTDLFDLDLEVEPPAGWIDPRLAKNNKKRKSRNKPGNQGRQHTKSPKLQIQKELTDAGVEPANS